MALTRIAGTIAVLTLQFATSLEAQDQVIELPFGNKVTVTKNPSGTDVVELPFGSVLASSVWQHKTIQVCWENPEAAVEQRYLALVKDAVKGTWERESQLVFSEWSKCEANSRGIRIRISENGPHVKALGRYLDGRPDGMELNFTFNKWSPDCQHEVDFCVWALAVHEFGHAIGFAHEQNRQDAPFECQAERQGTDGDWNVTTYDPNSIMNYCNTEWSNNGKLSERDIEAVRTIYGVPQ